QGLTGHHSSSEGATTHASDSPSLPRSHPTSVIQLHIRRLSSALLRFMEVKRKDAWGLLRVILLGQLVAFTVASSSFASSLIANLGVDAPLTQSFFGYLLLNLVYMPIVLYRRWKLQIAWYWYLALAFVDVQGNYL
ncbi:unnamed protein product, partial [Urochloa humidicola]